MIYFSLSVIKFQILSFETAQFRFFTSSLCSTKRDKSFASNFFFFFFFLSSLDTIRFVEEFAHGATVNVMFPILSRFSVTVLHQVWSKKIADFGISRPSIDRLLISRAYVARRAAAAHVAKSSNDGNETREYGETYGVEVSSGPNQTRGRTKIRKKEKKRAGNVKGKKL